MLLMQLQKEIMQNKLLYNYLQEEKPLLYFLRQEFCSRKAGYVCFMSVYCHFQQFLDSNLLGEKTWTSQVSGV
jgi:hypothetical protein